MPWLSRERRAATRELNERLPAINAILRSLGPSAGWVSGTSLGDHAAGLNRIGNARRLLSAARTMADTANDLGEPALPLKLLHPVVSYPAQPLWALGSYRHAVSDAATNLNNYTQTRLRRHDVSDKDLMAQLFTTRSRSPASADCAVRATRAAKRCAASKWARSCSLKAASRPSAIQLTT